MSKTVKQIIMRDYASRIQKVAEGGGVELHDAMLISIRGLKAVDTTKLRGTLAKKNIRVTVVRNSLARKTFENTTLAALSELLTGANAIAYGGNSVVEVAREVVEIAKKMPGLELRGAVLDGLLFKGKAGVEELSKFPTRSEAIGQAVALILSPAKNLVGQVLGPGRKVGGLIKAIEDKLEKGEAIAKVG
ncbi:MAG: 50S ribosomal protein L10 [Phycisphaerales bacterium]